MKLQHAEAESIRQRIMQEMMTLEEERMERMKAGDTFRAMGDSFRGNKSEDDGIIRRELNRVDPSGKIAFCLLAETQNFSKLLYSARLGYRRKVCLILGEKFILMALARIRASSPYGHLANWDVLSVIVKTGTDLRQEQLAVLLIQEFDKLFKEENCACWLRPCVKLFSRQRTEVGD